MEQENKQCSNCLKQFPQDKIDLHEAYCCRNIRKCKHCEQMVDIQDQQTHDKQFHTKKPCGLCNHQFDPEDLSKHAQFCPKRPMLCKYCENQVAFEEHLRHEDTCGSRTQVCTICQRPIMLKDFSAHENRCQRRREERAEVSQDQYRQHRRHEIERPLGERDRQSSTNNIREGHNRSNSIQRIPKPPKIKPNNIIGPELIKPVIDPVPVSVRIAMKAKEQQRIPLKSKN